MNDAIKYITENWGTVLNAATTTVTAAAAIAAVFKTPKADGILKWLMKAINWLALNVGNAKNKT